MTKAAMTPPEIQSIVPNETAIAATAGQRCTFIPFRDQIHVFGKARGVNSLSTTVMAFPTCLAKIAQTLGLLGGFNLFGPWSSNRFLTSDSVNPRSGSALSASMTLVESAVWAAKGSDCDTAVLPVSARVIDLSVLTLLSVLMLTTCWVFFSDTIARWCQSQINKRTRWEWNVLGGKGQGHPSSHRSYIPTCMSTG